MAHVPENITVSIIMATFNRAHLIKDSIDAIINQSFKDWECLIIDDGSTDETEKVVRLYSKADKRFRYFKRTGQYLKGLPGSRNQGLDLSKGDYIIFFDDDDVVHPENLKTCVEILKIGRGYFCRYDKQPFTGNADELVFSRIDEKRSMVFTVRDLDKMITGATPFASCAVMWDRRCFKDHRFNENLMYAEEWECYSRILSQGYEGTSINQVLYYNRKHPESNTGKYRDAHPAQINSQIYAAELVLRNLSSKELLSPILEKFFIRMGFDLKSFKLIDMSLSCSNTPLLKKLKYKIGYKIYPVLRPFFYVKSKISKI